MKSVGVNCIKRNSIWCSQEWSFWVMWCKRMVLKLIQIRSIQLFSLRHLSLQSSRPHLSTEWSTWQGSFRYLHNYCTLCNKLQSMILYNGMINVKRFFRVWKKFWGQCQPCKLLIGKRCSMWTHQWEKMPLGQCCYKRGRAVSIWSQCIVPIEWK